MDGQMTVVLFAIPELIPDWTKEDNGILLSFIFLGVTISNGFVLPLLLWLGASETHLLLVGQVAMTLRFCVPLCAGVFPSKVFLMVGLFTSVIFSFFDPIFYRFVTLGLPEDEVGLVLGVFASIPNVAQIIAPGMFTLAFSFGPMWPFALALALLVVALACLIYVVDTVDDVDSGREDETNSQPVFLLGGDCVPVASTGEPPHHLLPKIPVRARTVPDWTNLLAGMRGQIVTNGCTWFGDSPITSLSLLRACAGCGAPDGGVMGLSPRSPRREPWDTIVIAVSPRARPR